MQQWSHSLPSRSFLSGAEGEVRLGLSHRGGVAEQEEEDEEEEEEGGTEGL